MSIRRRSRVDTLAPRESASWLVIRRAISRVVSFLEVPPRADLRDLMRQTSELVRAHGEIEDFDPRQSTFFFRVPSGRYCLELQFAPPINPLREWVLPERSVSIAGCVAVVIAGADEGCPRSPPP